ncbi:MAG: DUF6600 domain-containing protein [Pyrinomonadaceae bacterium]
MTNTTNAFGFDEDDYTPDVTARVARINVIRGDAQIRHTGSQDWERATLNLPVVEGDEITTSLGTRLEIQFDSYNYLRLWENAYLKITTLRDEGIAVSLPQGTLSLRALEFNKDKTFFEIDAPKTTIALQQPGMYRVDAGDSKSAEIRVTVTEEGQARIYSENNGATLRNGRSMRIYLDGNTAGEWEIADASRYADDFDSWALERDAIIAKRMRDNYNNNYYDRDIYGADDLSENGEWIFTKKYGYVWKPYRNAISQYADWSPYRYGHWRWIPPFGWTWVNDEPWGWATYHHGRWIYVDREWCWTPYAYYRPRRSWWSPALVVVTYSGSYICWYPLPYNYGYYNYNHTTIINNTTVVVNPTPTPTGLTQAQILANKMALPNQLVPPLGVVAVNAGEFGRSKTAFKVAPQTVAEQVLSQIPDERQNSPVLPSIRELNGRVSKDIIAETPKNVRAEAMIKTGVTERKVGVSMNERLQKERVLDNRENADTTIRNSSNPTKTEIRDTGAVKRQTPVLSQDNDANNDTPVKTPRNTKTDDTLVRPTGGGKSERDDNFIKTPRNEKDDRNQTPVRVQPKRNEDQYVKPPVYVPPTKSDDQPVKQPSKPTREQNQPVKQQPQEQPKKEQPKEEQKPRVDRKSGGKID